MIGLASPTHSQSRRTAVRRRFEALTDGQKQRWFHWVTVSLVVVGTGIRFQQLTHSLLDAHAFRQTQTAFTVREYAESGIDLGSTPLPIFGPDADVPFEFPLFQALAALVTRLGLEVSTASRLMGLVSFQASAVLLVVLVRRWHGRSAALVALVLFEFLPFGLQWGAASMIDFLSVAFALGMVVALDSWFRSGRLVALGFGAVASSLAFLVKASTAPCWALLLGVSGVLLVSERGWAGAWKRMAIGYSVGPGVGLMLALVWTHYTDVVKRRNELLHFLLSDSLGDWYFGTAAQRSRPETYGRILDRVTEQMLGVGLVVLVLGLAVWVWGRSTSERIRFGGWMATALSGPLVFFNLYFVHDYYLMAVYPAIVVLAALSIIWGAQRVSRTPYAQWSLVVLMVAGFLITTFRTELGSASVRNFRSVGEPPLISESIRTQTDPDDLFVVVGCDWNPVYLFFAERRGVMFRGEVGSFWEEADINEYDYVLRCGNSIDVKDYLPAEVELVPSQIADRVWEIVVPPR